MTETTVDQFEQVITQVREATDGSDAAIVAYLDRLEAQNKFVGVAAYFDAQNATPEPIIDIGIAPPAPAPVVIAPPSVASLSALTIPSHVIEELAKICTKHKKEMSEVEEKWRCNMRDPDMEIMADTQEEREREAWGWILLEYAQESSQGGRKEEWQFTLFIVDKEPGSYPKWIQKPGQPDPKNQVEINVGIAGGYGLFTKENDDGTTVSVAAFIGAYADSSAKALCSLVPFTTYSAEIEKGKQGFSLNDPVPQIKTISTEDPVTFTKMVAKFAKQEAVQPDVIENKKWTKKSKGKNYVIDCRVLMATTFVNDDGDERASLKVAPSVLDANAEPKAYYITFWREKSAEAFKYERKSRVLVGVRAKYHEEYDYSLTGSFVMPLRVVKKNNPPMTEYTPPE